MTKHSKEIQEAFSDISHETQTGDAGWISLNASSQALMMAQKRESRLGKGKSFHGFVLTQNSQKDNEFTQFLHLLKNNAALVPAGTRLQLAVLTQYIDPIKDKDHYENGVRSAKHWTAVDILVGENGKVQSFVLDAAYGQGCRGIHNDLKTAFPEGKHYLYMPDFIQSRNKQKVRRLQTQNTGCQVFVTEHLKQLSQIDSEILYNKELARIGSKEGKLRARDFVPGLKLTRILRSMQSWTGLNALPEGVKNTIINEKGETLTQSAMRRTELDEGQSINNTIAMKNALYKMKKQEYFDAASKQTETRIMEHRQGFTFMSNPSLFLLSDMLASSQDLKDFSSKFSEKLNQLAPRKQMTFSMFSAVHLKKVQETLSEINRITASKDSPESQKSQILFSVTALFKYLENHNSIRTKKALEDTLSQMHLNHAITNETEGFRHFGRLAF